MSISFFGFLGKILNNSMGYDIIRTQIRKKDEIIMVNSKEMVQAYEDSNNQLYEIEDIKQKIYTIRGKQVMLDSDIAILYDVETKKLNQAVKRNIKRFPSNYCFQLSETELENLRSQIVTSSGSENQYGGRRYLPYVFTEQGVAMLSAVLHSVRSIFII